MSDEDLGADRLGELAESFLARRRAGEALTASAFAAEHPADAARIVALFPTLAVLDEHAPLIPELAAGAGPEVPRELGRYALQRELGRGGMGIVYEAHDRSLDRRVALKVLPGWSLHDERARRRFRREARIVAGLRHPGIVPIHALEEADGVAFFVMDLIDGIGLDRLVSGEIRPAGMPGSRARWVAQLGVQAAETLAYAHGQGVLHRDIKPSNFLLDGAGRLWLADFGLARLAGDEGLTATGEWLGTLRYTAPECLRGRADARSDLYGLGLTLYELLVGVPAFPATDRVELVRQVLDGAFPPPRRLDAGIPADLEAVLLRAAAPAPEDRYPDAEALAADLNRFLEGVPVLARPRPRRPRLGRWLVALAAAAALVVLAAIRLLDGRTGTTAAPAAPAPAAVAPEPPAAPGRPGGPPPWAGWRRELGGGSGGPGRRGPGRGLGPPALRPDR